MRSRDRGMGGEATVVPPERDSTAMSMLVAAGGAAAAFYLARTLYYEHFQSTRFAQTFPPDPIAQRLYVVNASLAFNSHVDAICGTLGGVVDFVHTTLTLYSDGGGNPVMRLKRDLLNAFEMLDRKPCLMEMRVVTIDGDEPDVFSSPAQVARASGGKKMAVRHLLALTRDGRGVKVFDVELIGTVRHEAQEGKDSIGALVDLFAASPDAFVPSPPTRAALASGGVVLDRAFANHRGFGEKWASYGVLGAPPPHGGALSLPLFDPMLEAIRELAVFLRYGHQLDPPLPFVHQLTASLGKIFGRSPREGASVSHNSHLSGTYGLHIYCSHRDGVGASVEKAVAELTAMGLEHEDMRFISIPGCRGGVRKHRPLHRFRTRSSGLLHHCHAALFEVARTIALAGFKCLRLRQLLVIDRDDESDGSHSSSVHPAAAARRKGRHTLVSRGTFPLTDEAMVVSGIASHSQGFEGCFEAAVWREGLEARLPHALHCHDDSECVAAVMERRGSVEVSLRTRGIGLSTATKSFIKQRRLVADALGIRTECIVPTRFFVVYDTASTSSFAGTLDASQHTEAVEDAEGCSPLEGNGSFFPSCVSPLSPLCAGVGQQRSDGSLFTPTSTGADAVSESL